MRVTGPGAVWICRVRILSISSVDGTVDSSKLFLTAKQAPCSLSLSNEFSCQKKVKFHSLTELKPGSLVSCRVTMSICRLLGSQSITAVLRASLMY